MVITEFDEKAFAEDMREEGRKETRVEDIQSLMTNLSFTAEKAMEALGIPESEYEKYKLML